MTVERLLAAFPIGTRVVVDSLYEDDAGSVLVDLPGRVIKAANSRLDLYVELDNGNRLCLTYGADEWHREDVYDED